MDIERNRHHNHQMNNSPTAYRYLLKSIRLFRYFPFLMIFTLYIWGIYVYIYYVIYEYYSERILLQTVLIIVFIPIYLLSLISYLKCVFQTHRSIQSEFSIPSDLQQYIDHMTIDERNDKFESLIQLQNLPIFTRAFNGHVRYCTKCLILKPDRAHHCSTCGKCICKMDHHCHWVSNCVAFDNYKYFLLFLFYSSITCMFVVLSSIKLFLKFWLEEQYPGKFQIFFLVLFCFIFSMSILILLSYHIYLVLKNVTTLESYQQPRFKQYEYDYNRFDLGYKRNLLSVFGDNKFYWFLPIYNSHGDGHCYQLPLLKPTSGTTFDVKCHDNSLNNVNVNSQNYPQTLSQQQQQFNINNQENFTNEI